MMLMRQARGFSALGTKATNHAELRSKSLAMYKACMQEAPTVVRSYNLGRSTERFKKAIRAEFEFYRNVKDIDQAELLLHKAGQELDECFNMWKTKWHVEEMFDAFERTVQKLEERKRPAVVLDENTPLDILGKYVSICSDDPWDPKRLEEIYRMSLEDRIAFFEERLRSDDPIIKEFAEGRI
ncbi:hypothetical protein PROFUN_12928 [Planoprotostelium fungivorum]|uniref:Complex 1 LYR protein domain-containing protein n=1 Tax=Planoprotostelium fungivorum TaxID=1890364 RepID=A0A2P6N608_9EUKA|nr:hypothetical protein PROFUN_12928 [Planoprotostelium fungivorum]